MDTAKAIGIIINNGLPRTSLEAIAPTKKTLY